MWSPVRLRRACSTCACAVGLAIFKAAAISESEQPMGLSGRIEALRLVCMGCSNSEIAAALKIAKPTAHAHVEQAQQRLVARNRAHMAALSVGFGLVGDP